jgi:hypothetical protein
MSTTVEAPRTTWQGVEMSVEEFLALPADGIHRELIKGKVREECDVSSIQERAGSVKIRSRFSGRILNRIGQLLLGRRP